MCVSSTDPPHYQKRDNIDETLSTMLTATAKHGHGMVLNTVMRYCSSIYTAKHVPNIMGYCRRAT